MESVQIKLTPGEELIFGSLPEGSTTLLCSGGWVRDKLFGITPKQIQIILNCSNLERFIEKFLDNVNIAAQDQGWEVKELKVEKEANLNTKNKIKLSIRL